ncbi:MAG: hypothetical protein F6K58_05990 [Symploca sp. SIO2E9]|nr:hypothetical protein [Symploca sp. SIO2E9]
MERVISLLGLLVFIGLGYLFSVNRAAVRWSTVLWSVGLQLILAIFILKTAVGLAVFQFLGNLVSRFLDFSDVGAQFVFGEDFEEHFIYSGKKTLETRDGMNCQSVFRNRLDAP